MNLMNIKRVILQLETHSKYTIKQISTRSKFKSTCLELNQQHNLTLLIKKKYFNELSSLYLTLHSNYPPSTQSNHLNTIPKFSVCAHFVELSMAYDVPASSADDQHC